MIGHRVVLRPRSVLETGDLAAVFVRRHARLYVRLLPWVLVPALTAWGLHRFAGLDQWTALLLEVGVGSVTAGVYTLLCGDLLLQPGVSLRVIQGRFLRQLAGWLAARIIGWTVLAASLLFAYRWTAFLPEATLLERGAPGDAMSRSGALLKAVPGRALGFGLVSLALLLCGAIAGELVETSLRALLGLSVRLVPDGSMEPLSGFLGLAIVIPYLATMRFLLYIDCRTRREGWDLQVQMNALVNGTRDVVRDDREAA